MAVEGVNNNSNAGYYALGAAAVGAGAGAGTAYLTRPFLKDGAPTDEFIRKMNEACTDALPEEQKEMAKELEKMGNEVMNKINNAKDVADIKNVFLEVTTGHLTDEILEAQKEVNVLILDNLKQMGCDVKPEQVKEFANCETVEEVKEFMGKIFDEQYKGKTVEEIKNAMETEAKTMNRQIAKSTFEQFWDSSKKEFVNCEEGVGKAIKKAAKGIQNKYALIYGSVAAAVLGVGTYLLTRGGSKADAPNNNEQA